MAKGSLKTTTVVTLELSVGEAAYLKVILQNSLGGETEPIEMAARRRELFNALPTFSELQAAEAKET
jgi:hypothetical protein